MEQIIIDINAVIKYTKDYSYEQFISDVKTIDATMFRLQQMIEKIKNISAEFKKT